MGLQMKNKLQKYLDLVLNPTNIAAIYITYSGNLEMS